VAYSVAITSHDPLHIPDRDEGISLYGIYFQSGDSAKINPASTKVLELFTRLCVKSNRIPKIF
jgi:hypothetical protein